MKQERTSILVVDLRGNGGGHGGLGHELLKRVTSEPFRTGCKRWRYSRAYERNYIIAGLMQRKIPPWLLLDRWLRLHWFYGKYHHIYADLDNAICWFERQRELYPADFHSAWALFHQQTIYVHDLHDYETGAQRCRQYLEEYPDGDNSWGSLWNLALCREKLGNTAEAARLLREAHEKAESDNLRREVMDKITLLEQGGAQ